LIAKINGIDIRQHGSGNIGATNVLRTLGKQWGIPCFILDFLKGLLPVIITQHLIDNGTIPATASMATVLAAFGTVLGHIYTIFLKFKGGKGIATSAGCLIGLAPIPLIGAFVAWIITFYSSRYVSLASIVAASLLPINAIIMNQFNIGTKSTMPEIVLLALLAALAIYRHKSNIKKLIAGTENKFEKKTKGES
jgi:glycerol-3-phosphate acyltransferase PlsY